MAGISTGGSKSGRKSVDQEVSMVPFIDLLIVTIAFLLVTAVWTSMARIPTSTNVPDKSGTQVKEERAALRVKVANDGRVVLQWQKGTKIDDVETVPVEMLADAIKRAYFTGLAMGHVTEPKKDEPAASAILAVPAAMPVGEITSVMDAIHSARLKDGRSAFAVTFSVS
jgi:biopolymer transport protein ExbD